MSENQSLAEALPAAMARVRDELIPAYQSIGPAGNFAIMMMRRDLDLATKAIMDGDVVAMLRQHHALQEYKL